VVAILFAAGDHVPLIPLVELVGSVKASPLQIGPTGLNVGSAFELTVTVIDAVLAHCPMVGVNV
jgi:hypothetical protein